MLRPCKLLKILLGNDREMHADIGSLPHDQILAISAGILEVIGYSSSCSFSTAESASKKAMVELLLGAVAR